MRTAVLTSTTQRLYSLIATIDQKGQGIILLNSLIIPLAISGMHTQSLQVAAILTTLTAVLSIFAAIMSIYPKRRGGAKPDGSVNLLHFGDIGRMREDEFLKMFNPVFNDNEKLSQEAVKDMHDISRRILLPKYRWLKIAYIIFFCGNVIAISIAVYSIVRVGELPIN